MINPFKIPKRFTRTYLEEFILFAIVVANKPALQMAAKLNDFLSELSDGSPFFRVKYLMATRHLDSMLRKHRMGQYGRISKAFRGAMKLDLDNLTVEALEMVHGIGPKTARFIMLYYKPKSNIVPLDTHVLKFLGELGYTVPKSTPTGQHYLRLERAFLAEAGRRNMTAKELDTQVWQSKANRI